MLGAVGVSRDQPLSLGSVGSLDSDLCVQAGWGQTETNPMLCWVSYVSMNAELLARLGPQLVRSDHEIQVAVPIEILREHIPAIFPMPNAIQDAGLQEVVIRASPVEPVVLPATITLLVGSSSSQRRPKVEFGHRVVRGRADVNVVEPELALVVGGIGEGFVAIREVHIESSIVIRVEYSRAPCPSGMGEGMFP